MTLRIYDLVKKEYDNYPVTLKKALPVMIFSFMLSLFLVSIPTIVLINLLIFKDYVKLIAFGFSILIILLLHLTELFYDLGITEGKISYIYAITNRNIVYKSLFVFIIYVALLAFEVI